MTFDALSSLNIAVFFMIGCIHNLIPFLQVLLILANCRHIYMQYDCFEEFHSIPLNIHCLSKPSRAFVFNIASTYTALRAFI